ncbi:MAG: hypothetical protein AB1898_15280 [Acidobacteriota bacterium]
MSSYTHRPADVSQMQTRSISNRKTKVQLRDFSQPYQRGAGVQGLLGAFPNILAGTEFRALVRAVVAAKARRRALIWGLGGHVIKCGLSPVLIGLMREQYVTAICLNGAGAIHDFEIALCGSTSEDVEQELEGGEFGSSEETCVWMNEAAAEGAMSGLGYGEALGEYIHRYPSRFPHRAASLLATAYSMRIPVTVHIALGTDTIHNHPSADGKALGQTSLQDFRLLTSLVGDLHDGGVYVNCGSAVVLPEVFLKAVSMNRNLKHPLEGFTTANLDFFQHYRPVQNVLRRPTQKSGRGIGLNGHHEIMIPLLAAAILESDGHNEES